MDDKKETMEDKYNIKNNLETTLTVNVVDHNCEFCNYKTTHKSHYLKHLLTAKHCDETLPSTTVFSCECGKKYKHRQGLWKHKKTCGKIIENERKKRNDSTIDPNNNEINDSLPSDKEIILLLIKQNENLQKLHEESQKLHEETNKQQQDNQNIMLELIKSTTNISNITNNKIIKPTFNLNFFLNETCKDAMNIMEFIEQSKVEFNDFLQLETQGFVNGISNIIVKNLKALDIEKRPVHCTDLKRGTVYIKDNNEWEKEEENKPKLRKMIRKVADKNIKFFPKFKEAFPDYAKYNTKTSDRYSKLVVETLGGSGDNDAEKEDKIIKKITKEILV